MRTIHTTLARTIASVVLLLAVVSFTKKDISWVAIGDSITYLNDHPDETGNRVTKGYLTRVADKLQYVHYVNQGHNGWTVEKIADEIEKLGIPKADVYTVFLGTNDWWHSNKLGTIADYQNGTGTGTVFGAYRVIINKLRALNPDARIILITPMQRGDFVYIANHTNNAWGSYKEKDGQQLEQFANAVTAIGQTEHFQVVDLYHDHKLSVERVVKFKHLKDPQTGSYRNYQYPDYTSIPFDPATDEYPYPVESIDVTYDGLHPSDKGNKEIAKLVARAIRKAR